MSAVNRALANPSLIAPAFAAVAGLIALVLWVAPFPFLKPPAPPAPPPLPVTPLPVENAAPVAIAAEPWEPLTELLESIREKAPEMASAPDPSASSAAPPPPPAPVKPALGWSFKGVIEGPGSRAALVALPDGRSRFLFVGQRVPDYTNTTPNAPAVVVEAIEADVLIVRRGDEEVRVQLTRAELANPLQARADHAGKESR
jgi:hypothetical protein